MTSPASITSPTRRLGTVLLMTGSLLFGPIGCKRSEAPQPDYLKTQRDAMERAKDVGKTMQKGVDQEGKRADEESK